MNQKPHENNVILRKQKAQYYYVIMVHFISCTAYFPKFAPT